MGSFESSEMEIVAYGRSCAEAIFGSPGCHLFNTSHLELPQHLHSAPPPPWARHGSWLIRAAVAERPIGIAWTLPWVGPEPWANIEEVAVVAAWQRRGIGSALVRESMQWMAEKGVQSVSVCPISGSYWIENLGFSPMAGGSFIRDISDLPTGMTT
jgi:GNAT superfamily N-acetyltransferase